jgi:hypothetical protein
LVVAKSAYVTGSTCDSSKAVRELNYRFVRLCTMVEDAFAWLRPEGYI